MVEKKSFIDPNQTKIVIRHLPPSWTSEQFLEAVSPLPDHDFYRFCKADLSLGQQFSFSRAYLNIPNRQDLILFVEKFQGYIFLDKNGNEYICSVEYAPNPTKPKSESQMRKDPKINSIDQDPEFQTFVANLNAPVTAAEALPNAEAMLEEIEKKQREIYETKNKSGVTTTPLLEYLKRKREDRKQDKINRNQQRRILKQQSRPQPSNLTDESRPSSGRVNSNVDEEFNNSSRYGGNRSNQRGYEKGDYRMSSSAEQKRSKQQNPKGKVNSTKEQKTPVNPKPKTEENPTNETNSNEERTTTPKTPSSTSNQSQKNPPKGRPSMQIYNPSERVRLRRQQNSSSTTPN